MSHLFAIPRLEDPPGPDHVDPVHLLAGADRAEPGPGNVLGREARLPGGRRRRRGGQLRLPPDPARPADLPQEGPGQGRAGRGPLRYLISLIFQMEVFSGTVQQYENK